MIKVLVVEDDPLNRRLFELVLTKGGFEIAVAEDVPQARTAIGAQLPDLIVLDIQLPGIDGLQFARELRSQDSTCNIPIVAVSANAMASHRDAALDAGCTLYVTKPIDTRTFAHLLTTVFNGASGSPT
jgi:CheY-like chemotaxis protein